MRLDGRRLARAIGFTVVLFLLVGGGIGFVAAEGEEPGLHVPAPRPGDRAEYTVTERIVDRDALTLDPGVIILDQVLYEWLPERIVQDADFRMRPAWPLRAEFVFGTGTNLENHEVREYLYDAGTGEPLFRSDEEANASCIREGVNAGTGSGCPGPFARDVRQAWITDRYEGVMGPCGFLTPLHGSSYTEGSVVMPGACDWPGGDPRLAYRPSGWQESAGGSSFGFVAEKDARLDLRFDGTSPFPAKATAILGDFFTYPQHTFGRVWDLERIASSPGAGFYTPMAPPMEPSDRIPLGPPTPLLLDDTGMGLPLTMAEAYDLILEQVTTYPPGNIIGGTGQPNAAVWLADHPTAYLAYAMRLEFIDDQGQRQPMWSMSWADDSGDLLGKCVGAPTHNVPGLPSPTRPTTTYTVRDCIPDGHPTTPEERRLYFPRSSMVPDRLPLPSELRDRYEALRGPDQAVNRYGFQIFCRDVPCSKAIALTEVAHQVAPKGTSPVDVTAGLRTENTYVDRLQVDADGRTAWRSTYMGTDSGVLPLIPPADAGSANPPATKPATAAWVAPVAPAAAAGISLVAVLGGLLYYFWPSVKGLPVFGLFSRIRDDRVLEHPQRSRLMEAIRAEPGVHFQELARRLELGHGVLEHHVRKLVDAELVVVRRSSGYTCYFPKATDRRMMDAAPMLRSGGSRAVLQAVAAKPGTSSRDLASHLGLAPSTVSYHLKRLETAGLVLPDARAGVRLTALGAQASGQAAAGLGGGEAAATAAA